MPEHIYEARARLAAGMCGEDEVNRVRLRHLREGEHAHVILQGLCRAAVRGLEAGGRCKPCRVYIIASPGSGIHTQLLSWLFPGCHVKDWKPIPSKLRGKLKAAADHLDAFFDKDPDGVLIYNDLAAAIGVEKKNFHNKIRKDARFQAALHSRDLEEIEGGTRGQKGVQAYVSPFAVEEGNDVYTNHP